MGGISGLLKGPTVAGDLQGAGFDDVGVRGRAWCGVARMAALGRAFHVEPSPPPPLGPVLVASGALFRLSLGSLAALLGLFWGTLDVSWPILGALEVSVGTRRAAGSLLGPIFVNLLTICC